MIKEPSYIRLLNYIDSLREKGDVIRFDVFEERLLSQVVAYHFEGRQIFVGDLLVLSHIASQATLHKRVKRLIAAGYLKGLDDPVDARKKRVIPTKKALNYYEKLSTLLVKAASA